MAPIAQTYIAQTSSLQSTSTKYPSTKYSESCADRKISAELFTHHLSVYTSPQTIGILPTNEQRRIPRDQPFFLNHIRDVYRLYSVLLLPQLSRSRFSQLNVSIYIGSEHHSFAFPRELAIFQRCSLSLSLNCLCLSRVR